MQIKRAKCMHACSQFLKMKHGKFRHLAYMYFECFRSSSKNLFKMSRYYRKRKSSRTSMDPITTTSEVLIFIISWTLWAFSYYLITGGSAWVLNNLICIFSIVMRDKIVRLSVTCKINQTASKNLQNFIQFWSAKFWKQTANAA